MRELPSSPDGEEHLFVPLADEDSELAEVFVDGARSGGSRRLIFDHRA
jgi:hypothetical protein